MYTPEKVYHISSYNYDYVMYSILTESYDQGLLNKPSYMPSPFLVLEISLNQSKCTKHLISFLRHCRFLQVILVGNIFCIVNALTHTMYMLDDAMGIPVYMQVWKVGNDMWLEQHKIMYIMCRHVWFIVDANGYSPTLYMLVSGHLSHFKGRNIVNATCIHQVTNP